MKARSLPLGASLILLLGSGFCCERVAAAPDKVTGAEKTVSPSKTSLPGNTSTAGQSVSPLVAAIQKSDWSKVKDICDSVIAKKSSQESGLDVSTAYALRGRALQAMSRYQPSIADFDKAISAGVTRLPGRYVMGPASNIYSLRGFSYLRVNKLKEAQVDFDKATSMPIYLAAEYVQRMADYKSMAIIASRMGNANKAADIAAKIGPMEAEFFYYVRRESAPKAVPPKTIDELKKSIQAQPTNSLLPEKLALIFLAAGKLDEAYKYANISVEREPNNDKLRLNRGIIAFELQKYIESIADFEYCRDVILKLNADKNNIRSTKFVDNKLAELYRKTNRLDDAQKLLTASITSGMATGETFNELGNLYAAKKDWQRALSVYTKGIESGGDMQAEMHAGRAKVYRQLGQNDKAKADEALAAKSGVSQAGAR